MSSDVIGSPLTSSTTSSWERAAEATARKVAAASTKTPSRVLTAICDLIIASPTTAGSCRLDRSPLISRHQPIESRQNLERSANRRQYIGPQRPQAELQHDRAVADRR